MVYYVYFLIDPITGKIFYIGKGQKRRMYDHVNKVKRKIHYNMKLRDKILSLEFKIKYKKIFETENETEAYNKEKELIQEIGLKNLCNLTNGGGCKSNLSKETRKKISGQNNHFYGKKHSKETKQKMSESLQGRIHSKEHKRKISQAKKDSYKNGQFIGFRGKTHSEETKRKMVIVKIGYGIGKENSQYGTCWVYSIDKKKSIKIKKGELIHYLNKNWLKGRKIKF